MEDRTELVIEQAVMEKMKIEVKYILVECQCGKTWGANVYDGKVQMRNLICNKCAADLFYKQI